VPGDDVEGRVRLLGCEEVAVEFGQHVPCRVRVFVKGRHGRLEVPRIGQAVGSNWSELGQLEVALVELEDVASHGTVGKIHAVANAPRDNCNLVGSHQNMSELRLDVKHTMLQYNKEVAVG